jgi:hypothetical protein
MNRHQVKALALQGLELLVEAVKDGDERAKQFLDVVCLDDVLQVALNLRAQVKFSLNQLKFGIVIELLHRGRLRDSINKVQLLDHSE